MSFEKKKKDADTRQPDLFDPKEPTPEKQKSRPANDEGVDFDSTEMYPKDEKDISSEFADESRPAARPETKKKPSVIDTWPEHGLPEKDVKWWNRD